MHKVAALSNVALENTRCELFTSSFDALISESRQNFRFHFVAMTIGPKTKYSPILWHENVYVISAFCWFL